MLAVEILQQVSMIEWIAVIAGLAYVVLAARSNIWCWPAAFVGTAASIIMLWNVSLLMDSALNAFYLVMAVYGYWQWRYGGIQGGELRISKLEIKYHVWIALSIIVLSGGIGFVLDQHSNAAWPYIDTATTVSAVIATVMVARKILENWLYWIIIDIVSVWIYWERGLFLYAFLFALYTVIAIYGFVQWRAQITASKA